MLGAMEPRYFLTLLREACWLAQLHRSSVSIEKYAKELDAAIANAKEICSGQHVFLDALDALKANCSAQKND